MVDVDLRNLILFWIISFGINLGALTVDPSIMEVWRDE